jgi:sec-independent protein translocase protein TatC
MTEPEAGEMSFWDHLTELLQRLKNVLYVFIITILIVMVVPLSLDLPNLDPSNFFYQTLASTVINDFQNRFLPQGTILIPLSFYAPLEIYIFISVIIGAVIGLPVAAYQIYGFLSPALHAHEKKFALQFTMAFITLFSFGFALGYFYIVPLTFQTMLTFTSLLDLTPTYNFTEFFSMVGMILLVSGMLFTFPIYIYLLVKAQLLKTQQLTQNRKYMYGGLLILIAVVDPDPSLVTELVTFIPIVILMELSILISKRIEKQASSAENTNPRN